MNEHLRNPGRSNPHKLSLASEANRAFVAFHLGLFRVFVALHLGLFRAFVALHLGLFRAFVALHLGLFTVAKIAQFGKRMGKI
jgi:hypothetical protein